jgi:predicted MPP superfamily phosphohydrolase
MSNQVTRPSPSVYIILAISIAVALGIDLYMYEGVKFIMQGLTWAKKELVAYLYWGITCVTLGTFVFYSFRKSGSQSTFLTRYLMPWSFINYTAKLFAMLFLLLDDLGRVFRWIFRQEVTGPASSISAGAEVGRSVFLTQTAMVAAAVPVITMGYGIIYGAHNYKVKKLKVKLPHLPSAFHGLRIGQLSDIHSGSFFSKLAVQGGIEMLLREKPDIIFFTGDLVNNKADEMKDYMDVFNKVKAPLGVYATLGNHDYGDYITWPSLDAKRKNLRAIYKVHKQLGWQLLLNGHKIITESNEQLAVIGVENWGTGGFSKYGQLEQAYQGTEDIPVKLLLSHDPSHWDAQVRPNYPDIDITFSGHTHGFQFGIEIGSFKWSPVQYQYKQWAGLYQAGSQYLYVNRGYGYIGYPGRIGIWPEITIMELEKA